MSFVVAIDGPAGSGKGTSAKIVAKRFGLIYIDTGAMYRCVALTCIRKNIDLNQKEKIIETSANIDIELKEDGKTILNGEDVTKEIRTKEVSSIVSQISSIKEVRLNLVRKQREMAKGRKVIMEGRDITTYVFPNANVKIYLDCSVEERAKRRLLQMQENGSNITFEEVLENIKMRDENDKNKEIGSLMIAEDATIVDTTNHSIDETVDAISKLVEEKLC